MQRKPQWYGVGLVLVSALATLISTGRAIADDDASYRTGLGLLSKGLSDLAAAEFKAYLRDHPDGAQANQARYTLGVCLVRLGKHADAISVLAPVLDLPGFEFAPEAQFLRAQCALSLGSDADAEARLAKLVAEFPVFGQRDRAAELLGECRYRLGKFKQAIEVLGDLAERSAEPSIGERAALFASMAELALGDYPAAVARSAKLRAERPKSEFAPNLALIEAQCRQHDGALAAAAELYALASKGGKGPVRDEALLGLAAVSRARGDLPTAERALADATELGKAAAPDAGRAGEFRERVALERGKLLLDQAKVGQALADFAPLLGSTSEVIAADAALWTAKCEIKKHDFAHAADRLEQAAKKHPKSGLLPDMLFERAAALAKAGKLDAALEAWEQWGTRFGSSQLAPDALLSQAWCCHRLGKFEASEALCSRLWSEYALRRADESLRLLRAENAYALKHFEEARAAYESLIAQSPKGPFTLRAQIRRGMCFLNLGRTDEAAAGLAPVLASAGDQEPELQRSALAALGEAAIAKQDWPGGEKWFGLLAAVKNTPADSEQALDALFRLGICIERQGRFAEALPLFERVVNAKPDSARTLQARFERGQSLVELGRFDEAGLEMQKVVDGERAGRDPRRLTPHALRHLAGIASRQGRLEDAAKILSELATSGSADSAGDGGLELGSAWLAAGNFAEAARAFSAFVDAHKGQPKAAEAGVQLGVALNRLGKHEEALARLESLGKHPDLSPELHATLAYERALALRSLGRSDDAVAAYREALAGASPRLAAYSALDLAQLESSAGRESSAIELLDRAVSAASRLEPADAAKLGERGSYLRAACLLRLSKPAEAAETLREFAKDFPKSSILANARLLRGEALLASGNPQAAGTELAAATAPGTPDGVSSAAMLRLGEAKAASQDWTGCEQTYTSFLERFASSELWFQARFGLGWALENQGRHEAAISAYRDVVSRHKGATAARAQFQIGECLYAQKKHELAVAELLKTDVMFAYPEWSAAAVFEAGRCLAEMGRPADAAKQFADVRTRFPDTRWSEMAKQRLEAAGPTSAPLPGRPSVEKKTR